MTSNMHARTCLFASITFALAGQLVAADRTNEPLKPGLGPQLFLDDYLVERIDGLTRQIRPPTKLPEPVLSSTIFGVTQPYITVLYDRKLRRYGIWYNHANPIWHAESEDGIHWRNPQPAWDLPRSYGCSIVDDGENAADPDERFKLANWQAVRDREDKAGDVSGMYVGFSPDGFRWKAFERNPVLPTWPEGWGKHVAYGTEDIVDAFYDPLLKHYAAAVKLPALTSDGFAQGPRAGGSIRRLVGMTTSRDFRTWSKPVRIFTPDEKDDGLLEFYGMGGMHQRGGLYIGFVRILRDDLPCDPDGPKDGIGYTVLATSRDGITWSRHREPFLDRNHQKGSWDHAMCWTGYVLPVGEELFLYYGGYARGHKIEPSKERQIGLARMKRDRYVALNAGAKAGTLRTKPFILEGRRITVNADAARGDVRVKLLAGGGMEAGDTFSAPITGDLLEAEVEWPTAPTALQGRPVRLEFEVRDADLYGFEIHER